MEPIVIKEYEEKDIKDCDLDNLQSYITVSYTHLTLPTIA